MRRERATGQDRATSTQRAVARSDSAGRHDVGEDATPPSEQPGDVSGLEIISSQTRRCFAIRLVEDVRAAPDDSSDEHHEIQDQDFPGPGDSAPPQDERDQRPPYAVGLKRAASDPPNARVARAVRDTPVLRESSSLC